MSKRVLILQGHPDTSAPHLAHALADAYAAGAEAGWHTLRRITIAELDFPILRSKAEWESGPLPEGLRDAQDAIRWAEHVVLVFPLWLGGMPALFRAFLEQVARPGFALGPPDKTGMPAKLLAGRSARVIVTMGMPAIVYRWYFHAHSVKALERNILAFAGFDPVNETLIGGVDTLTDEAKQDWFDKLRGFGRNAE
jgi:putative NADPH-quinone reductase